MTLIEVERKRELADNGEAVTARLAERGYRQVRSSVEVDTYYSPQHANYVETVECLRVRVREGFAEITYKPASDETTHSATGVIAKAETDVILRDADQAQAANRLLACIGMIALATVEKTRTEFRHPQRDDITVAIDIIREVGTFIETEAKVAANVDGAALVDDVERQLEITTCRVVTMPYRDLVRH
jgi:adenylate cyclase class 2